MLNRFRPRCNAPHIRHLHARDAKGTASLLAHSSLHLSPAYGLILYGSPALSALHKAGEQHSGQPAARLAHELFHRNTVDPSEPLRPTRNKSLAAAHLDPRLQGQCLGLALRQATASEVRSSLESLGIASLARATKCSIARFERLVEVIAGAVHDAPANSIGLGVFLAFVWGRAQTKACLLTFLEALSQHHPGLLASDTLLHCDAWRRQWSEETFAPDIHYLLGGGSVSVTPPQNELEALLFAKLDAPALERLAYTIVARHGCAPEVKQERHGFRRQPEIADCVEACAREVIGLALWDGCSFDVRRLPPDADPAVKHFFSASGEVFTAHASATWFELLQARPGLQYMLGLERGLSFSYELFPSVENFTALLSSLLRTLIAPPSSSAGISQLGSAQPVHLWNGCTLRWWLEGDERTPIVAMARASAWGIEEELRIVFNGQRHCYALRNALASEPAWVHDVRRSWLGMWRAGCLPNGTHVAAARLLWTNDALTHSHSLVLNRMLTREP